MSDDNEQHPAAGSDRLITVGASAGGIDALRTLVAQLPAHLPVPIVVVLHVPPKGVSVLPDILDRAGSLSASFATDGERLRGGHILVAPPDHHVEVHDGQVNLSHGPKENGSRPSVDVLLRTAARAYGNRLLGVILSGALDDGSAGLAEVVRAGGVGIVQDPEEASYPEMPRNARAHADPQHVLRVAEIAKMLADDRRRTVGKRAEDPTDAMGTENDDPTDPEPWPMSCPDCHGSLREINSSPLRFRCRVGHAWNEQSLLQERNAETENALWVALRSLEERHDLLRRMTEESATRGRGHSAKYLSRDMEKASQAIHTLQQLLAEPVERRSEAS